MEDARTQISDAREYKKPGGRERVMIMRQVGGIFQRALTLESGCGEAGEDKHSPRPPGPMKYSCRLLRMSRTRVG
jgi:hypothetical protein